MLCCRHPTLQISVSHIALVLLLFRTAVGVAPVALVGVGPNGAKMTGNTEVEADTNRSTGGIWMLVLVFFLFF